MRQFTLLLILGIGFLGIGLCVDENDLCKRKPYLLLCRMQPSSLQDGSESYKKNSDPLPRPETFQALSSNRDPPLTKSSPYYYSDNSGWVPPVITYHHKDEDSPIDLSRPSADDVAREMGEVMRDDPIATNNIPDTPSEIPDGTISPQTSTGSPLIGERSLLPHTLSRHKRSPKASDKRLHDWVYLEDTDDLDYSAYRLRRQRLLRKLQDLDDDQVNRRYSSSDLYESSTPYSRYRYGSYYPNSGYYASSYYPTSYPSYGYSPSYSGWNPGYMGGYGSGYGQPFTFGIGSGLNIGIPYVGPIGVGTGLGVTVG